MKKEGLHINIKKEWFNQIMEGTKTIEYRDYKNFWIQRLMNDDGSFKHYDTIYFQNGYHTNAPFMIAEFVKCELHESFEIHVGKIIETGNLKQIKNKQPQRNSPSQYKKIPISTQPRDPAAGA